MRLPGSEAESCPFFPEPLQSRETRSQLLKIDIVPKKTISPPFPPVSSAGPAHIQACDKLSVQVRLTRCSPTANQLDQTA